MDKVQVAGKEKYLFQIINHEATETGNKYRKSKGGQDFQNKTLKRKIITCNARNVCKMSCNNIINIAFFFHQY